MENNYTFNYYYKKYGFIGLDDPEPSNHSDENRPSEINSFWVRWVYIKNSRIITHRLDGPATIDRDGNGIQWYCNNQNIEKWLNLNNIDKYNPTNDDILLIKLTFGLLDEKSTKNLIYNINHS